MSWEYVALGELYEVHNGLSKGGKFFGKGSPFLSFSTVFNKWFLPQELLDLVQSTDNEQQSYSILRGDVFVTRTSETMDELGMSSVALKDYPHATYNGFTKRLRPINPERILPEFIGYYLRTAVFRAGFTAFSTMTTRASLRNEDLLSMKVPVPDMQAQKHIASILSAYDDLIENNQKQIKLLEEAAQRLYKEWFVDLRFPGHETTPIVDGIPEGWKKDFLGGICTLKKDTVPAEQISTGTPYMGLEHMPRVDFCLSSWGNAGNVISSKFRYIEDDIIFGKIRPYFHKVGFALNNGVVSTDSFVMKAKDGVWGLLLMTVFDRAFVDYTYQTCKEGSKMPRADWNQMEKYPILIPSEKTRRDFEKLIWNITRQVKTLALQNHALVEARDRLLPKLMSGEIEV